MDETQWDIQEVKHLKKKQLVQINLVMLLLFVLFGYLAENGKPSLLIGGFCVLLWIIVVITLYVLMTGNPIGTKTSRIVQEFDRDRLGEKRWKRRNMIEAVIISVISVLITILVFTQDLNSVNLEFPISFFPFIGAWVGYNIGELIRMNNLSA
ncbi:accessory gene regulator B family protein [Solibacillus silvestris]